MLRKTVCHYLFSICFRLLVTSNLSHIYIKLRIVFLSVSYCALICLLLSPSCPVRSQPDAWLNLRQYGTALAVKQYGQLTKLFGSWATHVLPWDGLGDQERKRGILWEVEKSSGGGRTFACKLKSPVFWAYYPGPENGMLGSEIGWGLVILRRASCFVHYAFSSQVTYTKYSRMPVATPKQSKAGNHTLFMHIFNQNYTPRFKCIRFRCSYKNRDNT